MKTKFVEIKDLKPILRDNINEIKSFDMIINIDNINVIVYNPISDKYTLCLNQSVTIGEHNNKAINYNYIISKDEYMRLKNILIDSNVLNS